ncbi:MAG: carbon storage regulator CsrA [Solirubrobacterales bacterium]|jgi:carbon storage regulator|nr:carbon storage regulator CsrA [Solirubrobacterales bacterium]
MLVLTRKSNQSIMIGDDIEITVLSVMGDKVRIGIQAPREIPVFRQEVYVEIQEERGQDPPPEAATAPRERNGAKGASDARTAVDAARRRLDAG